MIDKFNGTYLCYKRSNLTFHDIMNNKDNQELDEDISYCGSFRNGNKRYRAFENNSLCFPNDFDFINKSVTPEYSFYLRYHKLNKYWSVKMIYNNNLNNPAVKFHYSLSLPCLNTN